MSRSFAHSDANSSASSSRASRSRRNAGSLHVLAGLLLAALWVGPALADDRFDAIRLVKSIPIPTNLSPLRSFDISWLDAASQRYYLADRSNAGIDVIDAKSGTFLKLITAGATPFAGVKFNSSGGADTPHSGPNGITVSGRWLFATDAGSRVVNIDLTNDKVVGDVKVSASALRADELAYDPKDGVLLVINNADDPPFGTLVSVNKSTGQLTVGKQIIFDTSHAGFNATNGAEQPVYDPDTGKFYLSIPEMNCNVTDQCGGFFPTGAVVRIDPVSAAVDGIFPVQYCQPAGLTVGPKHDLLLGCGTAFDTAGKVWTSADTNTAAPISIIMDIRNGNVTMVPGVSASDEVWFNPGDRRYYLAARNNPGGPVLGVIDSRSESVAQLVPTINTSGKPGVFPSGSAHSVAVNQRNNNVFVPLPANNVFPFCLNGCIAVFDSAKDAAHQ